MAFLMAFALVPFMVIYIVISADLLSKTIIALLGASVFVIAGFVHGDNPWVHVDWNVIILLFSMMIIVGIIKQTGLSQFVAIKAAKLVHGNPVRILVLFVAIAALFSALLGTVTTVMLIVPVSHPHLRRARYFADAVPDRRAHGREHRRLPDFLDPQAAGFRRGAPGLFTLVGGVVNMIPLVKGLAATLGADLGGNGTLVVTAINLVIVTAYILIRFGF